MATVHRVAGTGFRRESPIYVLLGLTIILEFARRIAVAYGELRQASRAEKTADS